MLSRVRLELQDRSPLQIEAGSPLAYPQASASF